MTEAHGVLIKNAGMSLLTLGGWLARRRGYLKEKPSAILSRIRVHVAAMPAALVCSVRAERYGGEPQLAAPGVFVSTLFSLVTVPALFSLVS